MATGFAAAFVEQLLSDTANAPDLVNDDIRLALIPNTNPPDLDDDSIVFLSDLVASIESASHRSGALGSKTVGVAAAKWFDAANVVLASAAASANPMDIVVYVEGASDAARRFLMYFDLASPITPNGTDVNVNWNAGGICKL